jgi:MSHA biogenesis protein MshK
MSLINDALKRAKEAQPSNAPAPEPQAPMQPVDGKGRSVGLPIYFVPALVAIICGGGFFLWQGWNQTRRLAADSDAPTVVNAREASPLEPADTGADASPPGIPVGRHFSLDDDAPTTASASAAARPPASAFAATEELPTFAGHTFKLQGIFYRLTNPSAVINSKSVFVGDTIANARVKAIDQQSVTLEYEGETKVLTLQ